MKLCRIQLVLSFKRVEAKDQREIHWKEMKTNNVTPAIKRNQIVFDSTCVCLVCGLWSPLPCQFVLSFRLCQSLKPKGDLSWYGHQIGNWITFVSPIWVLRPFDVTSVSRIPHHQRKPAMLFNRTSASASIGSRKIGWLFRLRARQIEMSMSSKEKNNNKMKK